MDGNDRTKLSALEEARQKHVAEYGSMLRCPERGNTCEHMMGAWITGCQRRPCLLDDPKYIEEQKRIRENVRKREEEEKKARAEYRAEKKKQMDPDVAYRRRKLDEIARLEVMSEAAYYGNDPDMGETYFNRAKMLRFDLKKWEDERKGELRREEGR